MSRVYCPLLETAVPDLQFFIVPICSLSADKINLRLSLPGKKLHTPGRRQSGRAS